MRRKVLSAEVAHETNTFSIVSTTLEDFRTRLFLDDPAEIAKALKGTNTEIAAHIDAAETYGWDLRLALAAQATPGGKVDRAAWDAIVKRLDAALAEDGYDGVILGLHGAMVSEDHDDAEGVLLQHIRDSVGENVPIVVTLDLHANVTEDMARLANAILPFRTYPHIDQAEISTVAADLLERAMAGEISPRCLIAQPRSLVGCNFGRTQSGPMADMLDRAERLTGSEQDIYAIGVSSGFPWADVPFAGPSIAVTFENGHASRAWEIASDLAQTVWRERAIDTVPLLSLDDIAVRVGTHEPAKGPLVIGDTTDNPGGGAYGDGIRLLETLLGAGAINTALAAVRDPQSVSMCFEAGSGQPVRLKLGAKTDPEGYGSPLDADGQVVALSETGTFVAHGPMWAGVSFSLGRSALVRIKGVDVILATHNIQITDRATFELFGIDPAGLSVIAVKSSHHFRAGFEPIAGDVVLVDSGGLVSPSFERFPYRKLRRPIWPLDPMPEDIDQAP